MGHFVSGDKEVRMACPGSNCGPGYASPQEAFKKGAREKLLYIPCIIPGKDRPDYLSTVDVDPESPTFAQIISRMYLPFIADEVHHTGWNACSSCYDDPSANRNLLIMPGLLSSRIYAVDVGSEPRKPKIHQVIEPKEVYDVGSSIPHTTHCLANGDIMISCMGDGPEQNGKGSFILIDGKEFKVKGTYSKTEKDVAPFGYDYWYQPYHNVMISTEWGHPRCFTKGLDVADVAAGNYGTHINVFDWKSGELTQKIDLGMEGVMPLEIRFLHDPRAAEGLVGSALYANVYRFFKTAKGDWAAHKVIDIPSKKVEGWVLPEMPAVLTDILISMDDKYLYLSCWVHGDLRQYDITDIKNPKLTGQIFLGGCITKEFGVKVTEDKELTEQPQARYIQGKRIYGGPQMIQLSLDGKRLYVTTSLFSPWDKQFYPDMCKNGSMLLQIDVDHENGGMKLNEEFLVDYANEPDGPCLAHEIRYPGGDCTSDIYLTHTEKLARI